MKHNYKFIQFIKFGLIATCLFTITTLSGQISIPNATPVTQNFDAMGTSATAALPSNWRMSPAGTASPTWTAVGNFTVVSQQASSGSPTAGGRYNWGITSSSDRALGVMTSGSYASPNSIMAYFRNDGTTEITNLNIAYDAERYRVNSAAASIEFFYSLNGSTWISVPAGDIAIASFPTGTSSYNFLTPLTINKTGITISSLSIAPNAEFYLRWNLNTTGTNSQGIGIDNFSLTAVFDTGCTPPTNPPSNFVASSITATSMQIGWTIGDGNMTLVLAKEGSAVDANPISGNTYTANASFGAGQELGTGNFVVYNGASNSVNVTNLNSGLEYYFAIYTFNSIDNCYNLTALTGAETTLCAPTNVTDLTGNCGNFIASPEWTNAVCADEYLMIAKQGSSITEMPSGDGSTYMADLNFGDGTTFDGGFVVYKGFQDNTEGNITGLTNGQTYFFKVFTRVGNSWSTGVEVSCTPQAVTTPSDFFRSNTAFGNWTSASSWESSPDGIDWITATQAPTTTSGGVTIQDGNTIEVTTSLSIDQTVIESGGILNLVSGTLTIANGDGIDLEVFGTFRSSSTITTTGSIVFQNGGVYQHNYTTTQGTIPAATWNVGSEVEIIGYTSNSMTLTGLAQSFYHFTWNSPSQSGNINLVGSLTTINGNFSVLNTGTGSLRMTGNGSYSLNVMGNMEVDNALLNLTNGTGVATISVGGDIIVQADGILTEEGSSAANITLNGTTTQNITVEGELSNSINFIINNAAGVELLSDVVLPNNLTLTDGLLSLTDFNLRVSNSILGGSADSYIQTNGAGELIRFVGTSAVDYPIGNSSFNPVSLTRSSGASELGARVIGGVFSNGLSGTPITTNVVNRTWDITGDLGASTLTLSVQWNGSEELGTFDRGNSYISHYTSSWQGTDPSAAIGGDPYIQTRSGIESLSPFAVASSGALPVTLLTFNTKTDKQNQILSWTYESPERFDYFEIEHSRDGKSFNALDRVSEGAIASRSYKADYTHIRPGTGIHYYRLKMVDLDGSFAYSQVVQGRIDGSGSVRPLSTFISSEGLNVSVDASVSSLELRLVDQLGRTIFHSTQSAEAGIIQIPLNNLSAGLYFLQVNADGMMETHKLLR